MLARAGRFFPGCCCCFPCCSLFVCHSPRSCSILPGFLFERALHGDNFIITDGILSNARYNHQSATIRAEVGNRALPYSKVAGRIVVAAIKDAPLLLGFAFDQVATTLWTE